MFKHLCSFVFLAALLCAPAEARTYQMRYEGNAYGVLHFGRAAIEVEFDGDAYRANGAIDTAGLAIIFARARVRAASSGRFEERATRPARYDLDHQYLGVHRNTFVDWSGETVGTGAVPAFSYPGDPLPTEAQRRAGRDPLATFLAMGAHAQAARTCARTFRVFDGRYIYDLTLRDAGEGAFRGAGLDTPVLRCSLHQQRIAGYRRPEDLSKTLPEAEIWFALDQGAPFAIPVRVSSSLPLGAAVIRLTDYTAT